jgi:hypothetical protein
VHYYNELDAAHVRDRGHFDGCDELLMTTEDDNLFVALSWYWQL